MSTLSQRELLIFFVGSADAAVLEDKILDGVTRIAEAKTKALSFTPVRLPHPL